jgi:hypothetical protein
VKSVRLSHIILAVGRVDVRVEDSRVRQGVESFQLFLWGNEYAFSHSFVLVLSCFFVWKHVKEVRLSHTFLAVGRVDIRVKDSRVRQGVESFKPFLCVSS